MSTIYSPPTSLQMLEVDGARDEAQLAAAAFLARYSGRTLDADRVADLVGAAAQAQRTH
jgi:hypothetical protein